MTSPRTRDGTDPVALVKADRAILIGASGTGKSTLAAHLIARFRADEPKGRILVLDTKPRWRGEWLPSGSSTRRWYRGFVRGDTIPGAMVVSDPEDWSIAWDRDVNPSQTVIVQRLVGSMMANLAMQVHLAEEFFRSQRAKTPSLIYFDEGMDFFTTWGSARGTDIVQRCFRAGRERNLASMIGVQRPKGINPQCLTETSYCALFRINYREDVKRLIDMGWPREAEPPTYEDEYAFRLWRAAKSAAAPMYRLLRRDQ